MALEIILAILVLRFLRKTLQTADRFPELDQWLYIGMIASIAILVIQTVVPASRPLTKWLTHGLLLTLAWLLYSWDEFRAVKSWMYAIVPLILVHFFSDLTEAILPGIYNSWNNYFGTAKVFAFVWMIAMWFITKRQGRALEKEKLKAAEKEEEYKVTEALKAELEVQVAERTADLTIQKEELQRTIRELKATQAHLIHAEKMASLGELTAGIAHEIQNPLNFVNNFSEVNTELIEEMKEVIDDGRLEEAKMIANDIAENEQKILHHGKRADAIVKGMLQHSRTSNSVKEETDINSLTEEYLRLAYHGLRAKDKTFNAAMKTDFDGRIGKVKIIPEEIGRVILNLIINAFYSVTEKKKESIPNYEPAVLVSTRKMKDFSNGIEIRVKDNGIGVPKNVLDKIFQPFFTTKPTGQGTGLGLSLSYDIVKAHGGKILVESREGEGAEFILQLPLS